MDLIEKEMGKRKKQEDNEKPKRYDLAVLNDKEFGKLVKKLIENDNLRDIRNNLNKLNKKKIYSSQKPPRRDNFSDFYNWYQEYHINPSMWDKHPLFKSSDYEVSDNTFFNLLKNEPIFLGFHFAQQKIRRWQEELHDSDKAYKAQENLKKIGSILSFKGWDKPRTSETWIALERHKILNKLNVKRISKLRSIANKKMILRELFPEHVDIIDSLDSIPTTNIKLANLLTAKIFGLKPKVIEAYLKRVKRIDYGGKFPAYILKNPR